MQKVEINIPNGTKVDKVDILDGIAVVHYSEKKEEFKKGDIIATTNSSCITIFKKFEKISGQKRTYAGLDEWSDLSYNNEFGNTSKWRLATPSEAQQLFDALAKQGKYWDAEALEVKDFVRMPESIGIYKCIANLQSKSVYDKGDGLFIGFNNGSQILSTSDGFYHVQPFNSDWFGEVRCYLQPIKREDLKEGDTAFCRGLGDGDYSYICDYCKIIDDEYQAAISESKNIEVDDWDGDHWDWYKLIPIND